MSGLETVGSVIAVITISYQTISSLYNTLQDFKNLPRDFRGLRQELAIIQQCTEQLKELIKKKEDDIFEVFRRFRFHEAISICAKSCEAFHQAFVDWTSGGTKSWWDRYRLWSHRKDIRRFRSEVKDAKDTAQFTSISVLLYIKIHSLATMPEKQQAYGKAKSNLLQISGDEMDFDDPMDLDEPRGGQKSALVPFTRNDESPDEGSTSDTSNVYSIEGCSSAEAKENARDQAEKVMKDVSGHLKQEMREEIKTGGQNDTFLETNASDKSQNVTHTFHKKITTEKSSKGNKFGVINA